MLRPYSRNPPIRHIKYLVRPSSPALPSSPDASPPFPYRDLVRVASRHGQSLGFGADLCVGQHDRGVCAGDVIQCCSEEDLLRRKHVPPVSCRGLCEKVECWRRRNARIEGLGKNRARVLPKYTLVFWADGDRCESSDTDSGTVQCRTRSTAKSAATQLGLSHCAR